MRVYLDNAATTPMAPEVIDAMTEVMSLHFGNPSSIHSFGRETKALIENARRQIGKHIGAIAKEIIFTSGGTEADNMVLTTAVRDLKVERIISSPIEHHAVGHTLSRLKNEYRIQIDFVKVNEKGEVDLSDLSQLLSATNQKTLVSLMHANNEIGSLVDLAQLSSICRAHGAYLHSDTVQTMGHLPFDLKNLDIDFVTASAHKFHGPKGVGFLYVNQGLKIQPLIDGGAQERGLRGGTENLAGIVGMAKAIELTYLDLEADIKHVWELKKYMWDELSKQIKGIQLIGDLSPDKSLYTVLNVLFPEFPKQEVLLFKLDLMGVACSGGSACTAGVSTGSHVLEGIHANPLRANARFSFSRYTTKADIDFALEQIFKMILADK